MVLIFMPSKIFGMNDICENGGKKGGSFKRQAVNRETLYYC